ncbi:MAG: Arc family DNA-binding protein [Anaerolineales bacterium]
MARQKLYPGEETEAFSIRIPSSMKQILQTRARKNRRSLNQEIVWLLEWALERLAKQKSTDEQSSG